MKLTPEQRAALLEARRSMAELRVAAENGDALTAAKALWADVTALIGKLDPEWDVRHALVAGKIVRLAADIVGDIERDTDCRSLFDGVDSDVRDEILHGWREIVLRRLKDAT